MSIGLILVAIVSISGSGTMQPICTQEDFQLSIGNSTQGDTAFIAQAVFDDYLEQLITLEQEYSREDDMDPPPAGDLMQQLSKEQASDDLFDTLLSSLAALNEGPQWKISIANLRRTVLLRAREAKNPWQGVVWLDISNMPADAVVRVDLFLQNNIDEDRTDRYYGIAMQTLGDSEKCRTFEKQAMQRWGTFLKLITPYLNEKIIVHLYPQIDRGKHVHRVKDWITTHIQDEDTLASARQQFKLWNSLHEKLNQTIVELVVRARSELGFDPWSRGCGQPVGSLAYKLKNELLQKSAEIQEFNNTTTRLILDLLTQKQRQQFEEE